MNLKLFSHFTFAFIVLSCISGIIYNISSIKKVFETTENFPKKYNLRDYLTLFIKNQHEYYLCWDFSGVLIVESTLQRLTVKCTTLQSI